MLKNLKGSSLILPLLMLVLTPLGVLADEGPTPGQIAGDNAWMLTSTALVLLMTIPGVALFYGGLSRKQNVLSTLMHVFAGTCVVTITWCVIGYSIAYSEGTPYYGGLGNFLFKGMTFNESPEGLPMGVDVTFQATFAIITTALIAGSFAERIKFSATLIFMAIWSVVVYAPIAHMVWGGGALAEKGILDFAGGTVVHINCGIAGLVAALVVGKRTGGDSYNTYAPHNLIYTIVGASLLWVGWFGFNAGSALAANETAGNAMLVTQIATAAAALSWMFVEWIIKGKPTVVGIAGGAIAGLVAITPASGFVYPMGALIIGLVAGAACWFFSSVVKTAMGYDDSFDVFGIHGVGGIVGALLTGVFCVPILADVEPGMEQLGIQFYGILLTIGWCAIGTFVILKAIDMTIGLRVSNKVEKEGLDVNLHGEVVS